MDWLTRSQIDEVIGSLSADDLIESGFGGDKINVLQAAAAAFNRAAERAGLSNGTPATQHVRPADLRYLNEAIGEALAMDSPLPVGIGDSPDSVASGG
jgi:hypothetical protein